MEQQYLDSLVQNSMEKIAKLRTLLEPVVPPDAIIVTCGSYARKEASDTSDIDFFSVLDSASDMKSPWLNEAQEKILEIVPKPPSAGGAFAEGVTRDDLLKNIGGQEDTNETITRRMLYLLEGEWLTNESGFNQIRHEILSKYVEQTYESSQLALFLLNDVIRYWRTITVDYSAKTTGDNAKPWGTRNIKLVFSRKLIYASGIFAIALTANRTETRKVEILEELFKMTPIERIKYVCGEAASTRLFQIYDYFLEKISDANVRKMLDEVNKETKYDDGIFRDLKNEGYYFSRELLGLFEKSFHSSHPIRAAVIF